jgi:hypothetical protein
MARTLALALVVPTAVLLAVALGAAMRGGAPAGPVYSPGQVKAGLSASPRSWAGRSVLVRGTLIGLSSLGLAASPFYVLHGMSGPARAARGAGPPAHQDAFLLLLPPVDTPFLSLLRGLPLVSGLVPAHQPPRRPVTAVYRLALFAPGQACTWMDAQRVCYDATLTAFPP